MSQASGLSIGFAMSFLAVGIPYWLIPYSTLNLPDASSRMAGFGLRANDSFAIGYMHRGNMRSNMGMPGEVDWRDGGVWQNQGGYS